MNNIKKIFVELKRKLRFERRIVILLSVLLFIAFAGYTQSWVFSSKDSGVPKPLLFDILNHFPFWSLWMILLLPLIIISEFFTVINLNINLISQSPLWLLVVVNVLYFYVLSRGIIMLYDWLLERKNRANPKTKRVSGEQ